VDRADLVAEDREVQVKGSSTREAEEASRVTEVDIWDNNSPSSVSSISSTSSISSMYCNRGFRHHRQYRCWRDRCTLCRKCIRLMLEQGSLKHQLRGMSTPFFPEITEPVEQWWKVLFPSIPFQPRFYLILELRIPLYLSLLCIDFS